METRSKKSQSKSESSNNGAEERKASPRKSIKSRSKEEGFTGGPDDWFDDNEYKKQLCADLNFRKNQDYYFGSYSHFYIHEEMLKDKQRTRAYQKAIEYNEEDFRDKIVLDIGAGTGILSIFAARAGAKHVYAIENADIVHFTREIVRKNGLEDTITVIQGKMEEIVLPVKKVDIIISEWMGYFLLYESMLDCVLDARDKYLKKGGKMLPDRAQIYVAAIEDGAYKMQKRAFWKDVYGVNMSCLATAVFQDAFIDVCDAQRIMSSEYKILDLDLVKMKKSDVQFVVPYELNMLYSDKVHGLVCWFDCQFSNLKHQFTLSTSPYKKYTHWKQTILYMDNDIEMRKGETLKGTIAVRQALKNFRELDIKISYHYPIQEDGSEDFVQQYKVR